MKKFFNVFFVVLGIIFTLLIILVIVLAINLSSLMKPEEVSVEPNSILKIDLPLFLPEKPVSEIDRILRKSRYNFFDVIKSIEKAKKLPQVKGILLNIDFSGISFAQMEEIGKELNKFKSSGKKVYAYFKNGGDKEYYLASFADKLYCNPQSIIMLNGLYANLIFFTNTFKKIGIEFETVKHGKYKSAVEPFVNNKISKYNKEMVLDIINSVYSVYSKEIAKNRNIKNIDRLIDNGPYLSPDGLVESNLVDSILTNDELETFFKDNKYKFITLAKFLRVKDPIKYDYKNKISVVFAEGQIVGGKKKEGFITDEGTIKILKKLYKNDRVKAIVLRVNSPGGSGSASDNIWAYIEKLKKKKPVIVSMGAVAASGGYYISMNANRIFADKMTITGSIGVFFLMPVYKGLYDKLDLKSYYFKTSPNATFLSTENRLTDEERAKMQKYIDKFYDTFITKAAKGRNMKKEEIDDIGQGRVWIGIRAKEIGLVDEFGGLTDAIAYAKKLAKIPEGVNPKLDIYPKPKKLIAQLLEEDFLLSSKILNSKLGRFLMNVKELSEKEEIKALMPYTIEIK